MALRLLLPLLPTDRTGVTWSEVPGCTTCPPSVTAGDPGGSPKARCNQNKKVRIYQNFNPTNPSSYITNSGEHQAINQLSIRRLPYLGPPLQRFLSGHTTTRTRRVEEISGGADNLACTRQRRIRTPPHRDHGLLAPRTPLIRS